MSKSIEQNINSSTNLLSGINYPEDLRKLDIEQLPEVCSELRQFLIEQLSVNPGHFASSMGAVELTVALHYVFNTPYDRIVWDVGHQAYGHKILTGRKNAFNTNRKLHGLSGFPNPSESEYDSFIAGHASNSISAALGMSIAAEQNNEPNRHVIAVIGDASISGGLAFEGLNNTASNLNNLLIVLNDNNMAIDKAVGSFKDYLMHINTSKSYNTIRYKIYKALHSVHLIDEKHRGSILRFNNSLKALISQEQNIFEGLNIRYFGPFDGHDITRIVRIMNDIKDMKGPKILHLRTQKGKGYTPAETAPDIWHAPGKFDKETGKLIKNTAKNAPLKYQEVFGHTLVELASKNKKIIGITAAMPSGTSMSLMMQAYPERSYDVGISEEHAVTFAAGLAKEGLQPFCAIYSTFLQRAFDQIIHDVAIQELPVTFCIDRAGIVGEDGVTHHGIFDLSYLSCIPNMTIASPMDEHCLRNLLYTAQAKNCGPFAIRYPRGTGELVDWNCEMHSIAIGKGRKLTDGDNIAVISIGPIGKIAAQAVTEAHDKGINTAHYDMIFLKPIDEDMLNEIGQKYDKIITVEDGTIKGGLGSAVMEYMQNNDFSPRIRRIGIHDKFVLQGTVSQLYEECGMDKDSILRMITNGFDSVK